MMTAQIIILRGALLKLSQTHLRQRRDFEKRSVQILHADRLGINLHFSNSHPLHHRQKTLIQSHIHGEREWQKIHRRRPKIHFTATTAEENPSARSGGTILPWKKRARESISGIKKVSIMSGGIRRQKGCEETRYAQRERDWG
jgi:hypothetical protein